MRPHADDLYLGLAIVLVVAAAVVVGSARRRTGHRPLIGGAAFAALVLLVPLLELGRAPAGPPDDVVGTHDVRAERSRPQVRGLRLSPPPSPLPSPPPTMTPVPIPTTAPPITDS